MHVDRETNLPEERITERRSLSSNHVCGSQLRKISIGVLVGPISRAETKDIKEAVMQIAENETSKGNCVEDHEGNSPVVEKHVTVVQKDTSPWVSTRSFNPKISSSVAVHDTERTTSFQATEKPSSRSKLLEKASAAHSLNFFAGKTGLEHDQCRKNYSRATYSMETGKVNNSTHVENLVLSTEPVVQPEKEQAEDKDMKSAIGGSETLRMKLWEILGDVSSPNKHQPSSQSAKLHPDQERDGKHSPIIEKINPNSDTIESDSDTHAFRRAMARSSIRKKASTKNQHNKKEATKSACHRKDIPQKRIFSFKRDSPGRLYGNSNDGSLPCKRHRIERKSSAVMTHQDRKYENAEERQQSENKNRSILAVEKSMVHKDEVSNAKRSNDRRNDVFEQKIGTKKNISLGPPFNVMTEQQEGVEQPADVEISNLKDQQADIVDSLLKNRRNSVHDPPVSAFEIKSTGCSPRSKQGKLRDHSPAEKIFNTEDIRSFKGLLNSKLTVREPSLQVESSDDGCELNDSPLMKPSYILEEESEDWMSKLSTDAADSESSGDDSHMKGCREPEQLSPEVRIAEKFLHGSAESLGNHKNVEWTRCSPVSESYKGIQDNSELQTYLEQNHEDALARAVALFTVALGRVKTKLKSVSSKKSAEILRAAAEEIFFQLKKAESQIETDAGKLTNFSQSKRKRLETRFQEQQEQLVGIYKRFKEEVDQHLQDYGGVIEDLEEHETELKRTAERQRAAQRKILSQVEQEIKVQLDDAQSRIMAVRELAKEKMLQLKLLVAESVQHGTLG